MCSTLLLVFVEPCRREFDRNLMSSFITASHLSSKSASGLKSAVSGFVTQFAAQLCSEGILHASSASQLIAIIIGKGYMPFTSVKAVVTFPLLHIHLKV